VEDVHVLSEYRHRLNTSLIRLAKSIAPCIVVILFLEIICRIGAFLWFDNSRYYLYYGFHELAGGVGISPWSTETGKHYKFPPHYVLQDAAGQASEKASINSLGFRGPDFQATKPAGVFRIICMGESSTFGFRNSDTGTYPFQLEQLFRQHPEGSHVEVINAGFPYYNTGSIRSLLTAEIISFSPDILTIYAAHNDASWPLEVGLISRATLWIQQHSIIYLFLKSYVITDNYRLRVHRWFQKVLPASLDQAQFDHQLSRISIRYYENVKAVIALARSKDIPIILIKQPMTTKHFRYASLSYQEEYSAILERFRQKKRFTLNEYQLVRHHYLIEELERIAAEENLPMVDNIAIVDQDRRRLASWVHLTEEGNLRLAEALKAAIEPYIERKFSVSQWHDLRPHSHR
jgi:lysophospholipase L1-like esterase